MPRPIARIYAPLADYFAARGATGGRSCIPCSTGVPMAPEALSLA